MWTLKTLAVAVTLTTTLVAGTAWYAHSKGVQSGMQEIQSLWDSERAIIAQAHAEETMKARQRELALRELADRLRQERTNEAKRLAREYAADLERLRNRPETRASAGGVPEGAAPGAGCTGEGLARPDAVFLAGYAADAARLQLALNQCQAAYESLRSP